MNRVRTLPMTSGLDGLCLSCGDRSYIAVFHLLLTDLFSHPDPYIAVLSSPQSVLLQSNNVLVQHTCLSPVSTAKMLYKNLFVTLALAMTVAAAPLPADNPVEGALGGIGGLVGSITGSGNGNGDGELRMF